MRARRLIALVLPVALALSACTQASVSRDGVFDPHEDVNRRNHEFNRGVDRAIVRPAGVGYSSALPDDIEDSIGNFSSNLALPSVVVNNLLQGNVEGVFRNTIRFVINSTLGFGGLFDPAGDFGIDEIQGDFGQTLYVWGVPEGAYVEVPLLGPSTERDAIGKVVDLFTNPLSYTLQVQQNTTAPLQAARRGSEIGGVTLTRSIQSYMIALIAMRRRA